MNLKWYFSTFIVSVALFFGVVSQQQKIVPNQEIVLQFSGDVVVQDNTFIGSGSVIREGVKIGKNCFIGMGQIVTKDVSNNSVIK